MSESNEPVVLTEVTTEVEAAVLQQLLGDAGIKSVYNGAAISGFAAEAPAMVRLLVDKADRERARKLLAERREKDATLIDWSSVDVGEPEEG